MERLAPRETMRDRRRVVQDVSLGVVLAVASVASLWSPPATSGFDFRDPDAFAVGLSAIAGGVLALRHRAPVAVVLVSLAATLVVNHLAYNQPISGLAVLVALYTVASLRPLKVSAGTAAVTLVGLGVVLVAGPVEASLSDWLANAFAVAAVWGIGRAVRVRRLHAAEVAAREQATREAQQAETRILLAEERASTAQEVQDLVAHHLTEVNVQVAAARRLVEQDPQAASSMLLEAERVGRRAIAEIRRAGGLLGDGTSPERHPQPGLEDVEDLVRARAADGADVTCSCEGPLDDVPRGVALTAYRVLEEALDVAARTHPSVPVEISLRATGSRLTVELAGATGADHWHWLEDPSDASFGLERLQVRVAAYGGQLKWGNRRDGGFLVVARFPLDGARS